jgi:hypothetical protein
MQRHDDDPPAGDAIDGERRTQRRAEHASQCCRSDTDRDRQGDDAAEPPGFDKHPQIR